MDMDRSDLDNIECVSTSDGVDEEEIHQHPFSNKSRGGSVGGGVGAAATMGGGIIVSPASSVHELLECPVCTNSMYPPIHQVRLLMLNSTSEVALVITNNTNSVQQLSAQVSNNPVSWPNSLLFSSYEPKSTS